MTGSDTRGSATRTEELARQLLLEKYEPIAIVGIGMRFPGDNDTPEAFAEFLRSGGDASGPVPADRWDMTALQEAERAAGAAPLAAGGGFVSRMDEFDPRFFNISPKEAGHIDPQHRWALECAWRALESAAIDPATLRDGNGGVYLGVGQMDFAVEVESIPDADLDAYVAAGTAHSAAAGRLSYFLGWRGPCLAVDTACSSSLVALHLAVQGLRRGECDIALAGGVNATHHKRNHIVYSRAGMLSPDGRCKTFDDSADGYGRSEGCGMFVLKRLSAAKRDGDTVLALVRGSAVRQDGESGGLTVPNGTAQAALMRAALESANLRPEAIDYVEAHGTGTSLGDPIEMGAIDAVFTASRTSGRPLPVGSVKTNIGHMEAAAGAGGVVKAVLQLREQVIYPHIHLRNPSRHIPWDRYRVTVPTVCTPWEKKDGPRRALVNSFGFAGTIASVVLEEAPATQAHAAGDAGDDGTAVFTLSAKSQAALPAQLQRYRRFLDEAPDVSVTDLCRTTNLGRAHLAARVAWPVADHAELVRRLDERLAAPAAAARQAGADVCFLFTGQGSQYVGMGRALYDRYPVFRDAVRRWDRLFAAHLGVSIADVMFGLPDAPDADLGQTLYTQPALFTLEHALAELWMSWNVRPTMLLGHSIGEIVAATVAGLFTAEDAVRLVAARARLMQSVSAPGGMVVVRAAAADVAPLVDKYADLGFGGFNAPEQCVVSGGRESLAAVVAELTARGVGTKALPVSHAFHSPLMAEVFDDFRAALRGITFQEPRLSFVSNVTGRLATFAEVSTPEYWVRHIAEPVDFLAGMRHVQSRGPHVFVEVGPSAALTGMGRQIADRADHVWVSSLDRSNPGTEPVRRALATCYTAGLPVDWRGYHQGRPGRRIALPGYEFDKKRYWLPTGGRAGKAPARTAYEHPLLGTEVSSDSQRAAGEHEFRAHLSPTSPAYLADHVVMGQTVFPGAGYVEVLFALQDAVFGETARPLRDLRILEPLFLPEDTDTEVVTRMRPTGGGDHAVEVVSRTDGRAGAIERVHATATVGEPAHASSTADRLLAAAGSQAAQSGHRPDDLYDRYGELGLPYGPEFRRMRAVVSHGTDVAVGTLRGVEGATVEHLPASVLDCAMQTVGAVVNLEDAYLPVAFDVVELRKKPKGELRTVVEVTAHDADGMTVDLAGYEGSRPVFVATGIRFKRVAAPAGEGLDRLFLEPRWLKRSLIDRTARRERRQVVVVGRTEADFVEVAPLFADAGVTVRWVDDAAGAATLVAEAAGATDVCWFWRGGSGEGVDRLRGESEANYRDLLALVSRLEGRREVRLVLVTEGAQWLPGDPPRPADELAAASLWGAGRVLLTEYPALRPVLVDLPAPDSSDGPPDLRPLADELLAADGGGGEFQIAYRAGVRHVRRLMPPKPTGAQPTFALQVTEYGRFDAIRPVPVPDVEPVGDEVSIAVHAAGLNFKDVLNALGMLRQYAQEKGLPQTDLPLGFEGAGTVVAVGPDAPFRPGDEVMFSRLGCLRSRVTVPSAVVVAKPSTVDFARAAAVPAAYVTAYHALHTLAGIRAGDRVLIHAAAGGVGQAAVRLAQQAGAEVFATASPRKWPLLRAQGIRHVMNSRTPAFAAEILAATGGRGVDVVLNSLSGEYIPEGVRALAEGGRFVELGKIGVWSPEQMAAARPDVAYHNFDLSELPERELDQLTGEVLRTVSAMLADGRIEPPPTVEYGLDEIEEAFSVLSRGANVGKLVLRLREEEARPEPTITAGKTYLVTGGLGALGRVTARVLVGQGARRVMLVGRRQPDAADIATFAAELGADVDLTAHACDITDPADVARIMTEADRPDAPLGGVVHAAGVLADAPFERQTWESIDTVLAAKMYGGWLLHQAVAQRPGVEFFVCYSSISSVLGAAGQANYAAANTYLDVLMHHRVAAGQPGLSLNWGPWAEVGMAAGLSAQHVESIEARGIRYLSPGDASRALVRALRRSGAQTVVGEFDWAAYTAGRPHTDTLFAHLAPQGGAAAAVADIDALLTLPPAERQAGLLDALRARVAQVLRFDAPGDIEPDARFVELGLDSLAAVELKNALESLFRVPLPTSALFDHPTLRAFAAFLDGLLAPPASEPTAAAEPEADADVAGLTDDEADAELAALRELSG